MAESSDVRPLSRMPSQLSLRAAFSRPLTRKSSAIQVQTQPPGNILITEIVESDSKVQNHNQFAAKEEPDRVPKPLSSGSQNVARDDIDDDTFWDTDLENEEDEGNLSPAYREAYVRLCEDMDIVPTSFFARNVLQTEIRMKYHGLRTASLKAMSDVLKSLAHIEHLDLEENYLTAKGCEYLCKMLEDNESILDLNLSGNKMGLDGIAHIYKMLKKNYTLQELYLTSVELDDTCAAQLADCVEVSRLKLFDLSHNKLGERFAKLLAPVISANERLETLNLSWNVLGACGAAFIAQGLKDNIRIKVCNLSWNGLGEKGGLAICDALSANSCLTDLDISSNRLTTMVASRFAKIFTMNDTLEVLRMRNNPIMTSGSLTLITALKNCSASPIRVLDLLGNAVEYEFMKAMEQLLQKKPNIQVTHGTVMRVGNTRQDLGKRGIDLHPRNQPSVQILDKHLIVHNKEKLRQLLLDFSNDGSELCSPEHLILCLQDLSPNLSRASLIEAVDRIQRNEENQILYSHILH